MRSRIAEHKPERVGCKYFATTLNKIDKLDKLNQTGMGLKAYQDWASPRAMYRVNLFSRTNRTGIPELAEEFRRGIPYLNEANK